MDKNENEIEEYKYEGTEQEAPSTLLGNFKGMLGSISKKPGNNAASDERLKNIFGDNEDAIKVFANLDAIKFTYNDKAKEIPDSEDKGVDDDMHYGLKAQDLAKNPLTESAVKKDPLSDYLEVDTKELTMANTAIISEICKRILIIEKVLGIKVV